ncbi:MAG TPA: hypothetical protein VF746_28625 [Longimicrobium sp.]|jgi:hypothetical protein
MRRWHPLAASLAALALTAALSAPGAARRQSCDRSQVFRRDMLDNFRTPGARTQPSSELRAYLAGIKTGSRENQGYDNGAAGTGFGDSFTLGAEPVCSVLVEIAVRKAPQGLAGTGWSGDEVRVGRAPFAAEGQILYRDSLWAGPNAERSARTLHIPLASDSLALAGVNAFLEAHGGVLDVAVGGHSNVDYVAVYVTRRLPAEPRP